MLSFYDCVELHSLTNYFSPVYRRLSDLDQDGCLNAAEFAVAMHLIRVVLRDHTPLPATCPAPIQGLVKQCMYPQLPVATQAHLDKCRKAFGAFFENVGHGVMGGQCYSVSLNGQNFCSVGPISLIF